jgi:lysophosphatidic acid acyltransferase/lysophosphatidylinositol acyltransferase
MFFPDDISEDMFDKELTVCVSNHKYELDWLWCWLVDDKFKQLGNAKGIAKKSLRLMPVMGWCWYFSEFIFLARNWEQDSLILGQCLDQFIEYVQPVLILLFCEGTRFTKEKYESSIEFAQKKGLPQFKYHLLPRSRGFVYIVQHLTKKNKLASIYNIQIAFHDKNNHDMVPNFVNVLKGNSLVGDVYIERIPIDKVDTSSEETINKFLLDLYQTKDELMEYHKQNAKFPGTMKQYRRRLTPLFNWMFWFVTVVGALVWLMSQGVVWLATVLLILFSGVILFLRIVGTTKAKKGSNYGVTPKATPKTTPKRDSSEVNPIKANGDPEDEVMIVTQVTGDGELKANGKGTDLRNRTSEQNGRSKTNDDGN